MVGCTCPRGPYQPHKGQLVRGRPLPLTASACLGGCVAGTLVRQGWTSSTGSFSGRRCFIAGAVHPIKRGALQGALQVHCQIVYVAGRLSATPHRQWRVVSLAVTECIMMSFPSPGAAV